MSKISQEFLTSAIREFERYRGDKKALNDRVRENDYWYKARYGKLINQSSGETQPVTAFIFSAIENKYADAVDSYPQPNILERAPKDIYLAKILSSIVPAQLEISDFKSAYKINWRRKLKHGTAIYGVFYSGGEIVIKPVSILNVYCDMHTPDVQDSRFLFITNAVDNEQLRREYPEHKEKFSGNTTVEGFEGTHEMTDKTEIVDCYYKKDGRVECMKLCANEIIASTEDDDYPDGLYAHGKYPVVFDTLYPEEDCPFGFGIIDVAKNPQVYIDRLDGAIIKNSILSSKLRFMIKDNGSVNENEVLNYDNDIIHVAGSVDTDSIRELRVSGLNNEVMTHRTKKIDELKEVIGNRDFQQGGTNNGVTAASAITVLQEAGSKLSRAMIDDSYDSFRKIVVMVIELMREFFTDDRIYRVADEAGGDKYVSFPGKAFSDGGFSADSWKTGEPVELDISIVPQKKNPFQREANNKTIMELWKAGFFEAQNINSALIAIQTMTFDGKDKVTALLKDMQTNSMQQGAAAQSGAAQTGVPAGYVNVNQAVNSMGGM